MFCQMASFLQNPETVRELGTHGHGIMAGSFVKPGMSKEPVIFQTSEQGLPAVAVAVPAVCLSCVCDKSMRWARCHPQDGGLRLQRGSPQSPFPGGAFLTPRTQPHNVWETPFLLRREFVPSAS